MPGSRTNDPEGVYENAELTFLGMVREGRYSDLADAARAVAEAADAWQRVAYQRYFESRAQRGVSDGVALQHEIAAEKAELLTDLWRDLEEAYRAANHWS